MRPSGTSTCAMPAQQLGMSSESTMVRRVGAKLHVQVVNEAAPVATAASVRHSAQAIQGVCVGLARDGSPMPLTAYNSCVACAGLASRVAAASTMTVASTMVARRALNGFSADFSSNACACRALRLHYRQHQGAVSMSRALPQLQQGTPVPPATVRLLPPRSRPCMAHLCVKF